MEAHTGAIRIPGGPATWRSRRWLYLLREYSRARRSERAARTYSARANRSLPGSMPGSEHTHLLPPKGVLRTGRASRTLAYSSSSASREAR